MLYPSQSNGYSANVRGLLVVGERRLALSQVGPDFCILQESTEYPATDAELIIEVDQSQHTRRIRIPDGIRMDSKRVNFVTN